MTTLPISIIDNQLLEAEIPDPRYIGSPFQNLKMMGAKQKGSRYEKITANVYSKMGCTVSRALSTDYDRLIDNVKCEIKGSTLSKDSSAFSFMQIRPDQDYHKMIFSMFYPDKLVIMEMDKKIVLDNISKGIFKKQHGGDNAESRTFLYYGNMETLEAIGATYKIILEP